MTTLTRFLIPMLALAACTEAPAAAIAISGPGATGDLVVLSVDLDGPIATYRVATASGEYRVVTRTDDPRARTVTTLDGATVLTLVPDGDLARACADPACAAGPVSMDLAQDDGLRDARYLLGVDLAHLAPAPGAAPRIGAPFSPPEVPVASYQGLPGTTITTCYETGSYTSGTCRAVTLSCFGGGNVAACFGETCGDGSPGTISTYSTLCILY